MDWVPILSQTKSLFQALCGDTEGAKQTQENFLKTCPVISQGTSLVQLIAGDEEGALETQKAFGRTVSGVVNGIPVVGHVKGVVHYACGDKEGGDQAIKSSTRTIGVMGAGVGGFVVGGPIGAVAGGIAGGTAMDALTTGIDSAVHGEYRPAGHIATVTEIIKSDKNPSGKIFDLTAGVVFDGLTGQAAGQTFGQDAKQAANNYRANRIRENAQAAFEKVENNPAATSGDVVNAGKAAMAEMKRADAIQGIKTEFTKTGQTVHTNSANSAAPPAQTVYTNSGTSQSNNNGNNGQNNQKKQDNQSSNVVIDIDVSNMTVEEAIKEIEKMRKKLNREIRVQCKSLVQAAAIAETIVQRKNLDRQNRTITYGVNECSLNASIFYEQITGYTMTSTNNQNKKREMVTVRLDTNEHDQTHVNYEYLEDGEPNRTERLALFYPDTGSLTIDIIRNFTDQFGSRFADNIEGLGKYIKEIFDNMRKRFL